MTDKVTRDDLKKSAKILLLQGQVEQARCAYLLALDDKFWGKSKVKTWDSAERYSVGKLFWQFLGLANKTDFTRAAMLKLAEVEAFLGEKANAASAKNIYEDLVFWKGRKTATQEEMTARLIEKR